MNRYLFYICIFFSHLSGYGQGIDNLWMLGYNNAGGGFNFDFSTGVRNIYTSPRPMNFTTTSLTYCDTAGEVLFYTNGVYIANAQDDTMLNGSGLSPSWYTDIVGWNGLFIPQAALVIPHPGFPSKYFLFHNTVDDSVAYS